MMHDFKSSLGVLLVTISILIAGSNSSFAKKIPALDCGLPQGTVELRICADPQLKRIEETMRSNYLSVVGDENFATAPFSSFNEFIKARGSRCDLASPQEISDCILSVTRNYNEMISEHHRVLRAEIDKMKRELAEMDEQEEKERNELAELRRENQRKAEIWREREERNRAAQEAEDDRSVTFHVRSSYKYRAQVAFYSETRKVSWPGGDRAYDLNDSQVHKYRLSCQPGEKICMGAWATGNARTYWGVGPNDEHSCQGCCITCGRRQAAAYNLEYRGDSESQQTSGISAADILGAAIGAAGVVAGSGGFNNRSAPSVPHGPPPRTRDSGVSGGR